MDDLPAPPPATPGPEDLAALARSTAASAGLARALLGNLAEDAGQDVLLAALERPPRVRGNLAAWFRGALRLRGRHLARQESRRRGAHADAGRLAPEVPAAPMDPARRELRERLIAAVMDLPQPYRTPLYLRYFEELEVAAIALHLDRPESTVRTQLQRGLALLRTRIAQDASQQDQDWTRWMAALAGLQLPGPKVRTPWIAAAPAGRAPVWPWWLAAGTLAGGALFWKSIPDSGGQGAAPLRNGATATLAQAAPVDSASPRDERQTLPQVVNPGPHSDFGDSGNTAQKAWPLHVRSSQGNHPLPEATAATWSLDGGRASNASDPPLAADAAGDVHVPVDLRAPLRIDAPGHLPALLAPPGAREFTVWLTPASRLWVEAPDSPSDLQIGAMRVERFPFDLPPISLQREDPPGHWSASLAAGPYIVRVNDPLGGGSDAALLRLDPGEVTRWRAFDPEERTLEVQCDGDLPPHMNAVLLDATSLQPLRRAQPQPGGTFEFASCAPGEYRLVLAGETGEWLRHTVHVPQGPGRERLTLVVPTAALQAEALEPADLAAQARWILVGAESGAQRTSTGATAHFAGLAAGAYELWLITPGAISKAECRVQEGATTRVELGSAEGPDAWVSYLGSAPLTAHEWTLESDRGAQLPLLPGADAGSASILLPEASVPAPDSPHGSVRVRVPPGHYRMRVGIEGEARLESEVVLAAGENQRLEPPPPAPQRHLHFTRGGRPMAWQWVVLQGSIEGHGPFDEAPGPLWMLSGPTDGEGHIAASLQPGRWTATTSGGSLVRFDVAAETRALDLALD
ncbi:MAG: sigma-70 family RNA polymerase sigma factor [Planctomycetota bacterium]